MKLHPDSSPSCDKTQNLIASIYDAALDQSHWKKIIEMLTRTLKAEQGYMRIIDTSSNNVQLTYSHNKDHSWVQAFKDYYVHQDPWLNNILCSKNVFIACTHHHLTNKKYEAMEYYQDFVRPQKIHYGIGGIVNIGKNITAYFALNRRKEKQGFQNEFLEKLQLLTPHMQKALLINEKTRHIELEKNSLRDALDQLNNPVLLVNKKGKVLFINTQAENIIEQQIGIGIVKNHIVIFAQKDNTTLLQLIHQATQRKTDHTIQQGGTMNYTDPVSQSSFSILITPINPDRTNIDTQDHENALILLNKHQASMSTEQLSSLFKLTKAEARLTLNLCYGLTMEEISAKLFRSKNTLKTQLRSCFKKIGVSRQSELIRIVSSRTSGVIKHRWDD